jgi:hypothetical protein
MLLSYKNHILMSCSCVFNNVCQQKAGLCTGACSVSLVHDPLYSRYISDPDLFGLGGPVKDRVLDPETWLQKLVNY